FRVPGQPHGEQAAVTEDVEPHAQSWYADCLLVLDGVLSGVEVGWQQVMEEATPYRAGSAVPQEARHGARHDTDPGVRQVAQPGHVVTVEVGEHDAGDIARRQAQRLQVSWEALLRGQRYRQQL